MVVISILVNDEKRVHDVGDFGENVDVLVVFVDERLFHFVVVILVFTARLTLDLTLKVLLDSLLNNLWE